MGFFTNHDWFGRPGPFAYNVDYIVAIILFLALAVALPIFLRKAKKETIKKVLIGLWATNFVLDAVKYCHGWISDLSSGMTSVGDLDFPLWTCSMFLYLMPIVLFVKNEKIKRACTGFICTISLFAGIVNFAVPASDSLFSFYGMHKFVYHAILMLTPAIMLGTGYFKPKFKDITGIMITFIILAIPVYVFNVVFQQDYMYTYDGSWLPFDASFISFKPLYTVVAVAGYALLALLVIAIDMGIRKLSQKRK